MPAPLGIWRSPKPNGEVTADCDQLEFATVYDAPEMSVPVLALIAST